VSTPVTRPHPDAGLQPERTILSWGRTTLSLCVVSSVFLRWLPHYGVPILALVVLAVAGAAAIYLTQRRRYGVRARGIAQNQLHADVAAVLWTTGAVMVLGVLCLGVVLAT
jgi:hypothetical protein